MSLYYTRMQFFELVISEFSEMYTIAMGVGFYMFV